VPPPAIAPKPLPAQDCAKAEDEGKYLAHARRLEAKKDWSGAWVAMHGRSTCGGELRPAAALAELAYIGFRAGYVEEALQINAEAFAQSLTDPALGATILFNQGLIEEAQGLRLRAAASFARAQVLDDTPAVRQHLGKLPDFERTCQAPPTVEAYCECQALASNTAELFEAIGYDARCDVKAKVLNGRFLAIHGYYGNAHYPSRNHEEMLFVEHRGGAYRTLAVLGEAFSPGSMGITGETQFHQLRLQQVHGHALVIARASSHAYDQNGGGIERMADALTADVLCDYGASTVRCSDRVVVKSEHWYRKEMTDEELAEGAKPIETNEVTSFGYTIDAKGTLHRKRLTGPALKEPSTEADTVQLW
jgi:hypothetical protein